MKQKCSYKTIQSRSRRPHPATFPVLLPEKCVKLHGLGGRHKKKPLVVLDPFCGIGSTAIACMRLGGSFIGFDIDQGYLDEAIAGVMIEERELKELTSDMSSSSSESGCLRTINSNIVCSVNFIAFFHLISNDASKQVMA